MVVTSPIWMNMATFGVLIVEQLINACDSGLIYVVIYIRFESYVH